MESVILIAKTKKNTQRFGPSRNQSKQALPLPEFSLFNFISISSPSFSKKDPGVDQSP